MAGRSGLTAMCCALALAGCASITEGNSQNVLVSTTPTSGASCTLQNAKGSWQVTSTPGSASVAKTSGTLTVNCTDSGGAKGSKTVNASTAAALFGNALVGGIIGVAVDLSSGAAYYYPDQVVVALASASPAPTSGATPPPSAAAAGAPAAAPPPPAPAQVAMLPAAPAAPPAPAPVLFGDQVDFRCPAPGTEIDFRSGVTRIFSPPPDDALDCAYRSGGITAQATIFGSYDQNSEQAMRGLWPLRIGNEVSFVSGGSMTRSYNETYRVVGHERITVPAGTFDTFVIQWDASSNNLYAYAYHETASFWYAPQIGYVVKVEHHLEGGMYARVVDDEAVRIVAR